MPAATGTTCIACSVPGVTPSVTSAAPTSAAGAASTPNTNCLDVDSNPNIMIGNTEPYNPYTAGSPAICAYPIDIGMDTAAMIIPVKRSGSKFSFL